jgi:hypothetical protein
MEKDPTLLGMLGFVAQGATHPRWALDIITKGWPLKFGWRRLASAREEFKLPG